MAKKKQPKKEHLQKDGKGKVAKDGLVRDAHGNLVNDGRDGLVLDAFGNLKRNGLKDGLIRDVHGKILDMPYPDKPPTETA